MPEAKKIIEKSISNRPDTKKTKILIEKNHLGVKNFTNLNNKSTAPFSTMLETKKRTLSFKNQFSMPQTRKTNTFIEKTVRVLKPYLPTAWNF